MNTAMPPCNGGRFQKPLLIYSSPHEEGNTQRLLEQVLPLLPLAKEPESFSVFGMQIRPCTDCRICYQKECPLNGDGIGELFSKIQEADLVICATPVYFNGVPAPMKAVIDRSQQLFVKRFIQRRMECSPRKPGIVLTTAGSADENATQGVYEVFRMFYACLGIRLVNHIAVTGLDQQPTKQLSDQAAANLLAALEDC